ncbi:hypothetical protein P9869_23980 [Streptomyces ossamyceticus]|nr:hypothetical protein [Streptomyces ossamyceticus]
MQDLDAAFERDQQFAATVVVDVCRGTAPVHPRLEELGRTATPVVDGDGVLDRGVLGVGFRFVIATAAVADGDVTLAVAVEVAERTCRARFVSGGKYKMP